MSNPIKSAVRESLRSAKHWLQEPPKPYDPLDGEDKKHHGFAYQHLNCKLLSMVHEKGQLIRPNYAWGVLQAANMARALQLKRISVIEFGVAGGNGLVSLETIAELAEPMFDLAIDVYGFDTGIGLPQPVDYRDMPNIFSANSFKMDVPKLKARLRKAQLKLGLIQNTLPEFLASAPAPVGFVAVDVDLYSSTVETLKLLDADPRLLLPRVQVYFDDIMGCSCSEYVGERLAIEEFNRAHATRKLSPIYGLWHFVPERYSRDLWPHMFYMAHLFEHELYCLDDGSVPNREEPLRDGPAQNGKIGSGLSNGHSQPAPSVLPRHQNGFSAN